VDLGAGLTFDISKIWGIQKKVGPVQTLVLQEILREEVMKICPKCNKRMKKALQVMETEATWWEEEGYYVAKPNGKNRVYEKCLFCGTELQKNDGQILGQTSESFDDLVIDWIDVTKISEKGLGHSVQFRYPGDNGIVIAFIDGFGWLHQIEKYVNVFILSAESELWGSYTDNPQKILRTLKECVHIVLKEKGEGYGWGIIKDNIFCGVNG
jgi:predicted nucleic acid-binding Zn ribbon protein